MGDTPSDIMQSAVLTTDQKKDLLHRLARIEGQLRGVQKLIAQIETAIDCDSAAQQMAAARKALDRAFVHLLTSTLVTQTADSSNKEDASNRAQQIAVLLNKFA